jgi:hypothetical protein
MIATFNFVSCLELKLCNCLNFKDGLSERKWEKILKVLNAESSDPSADLKCKKLKISFLVSGEDWASHLS